VVISMNHRITFTAELDKIAEDILYKSPMRR
jgi:hypothetical protein